MIDSARVFPFVIACTCITHASKKCIFFHIINVPEIGGVCVKPNAFLMNISYTVVVAILHMIKQATFSKYFTIHPQDL